jgi:protein O-mannosyl-transferase
MRLTIWEECLLKRKRADEVAYRRQRFCSYLGERQSLRSKTDYRDISTVNAHAPDTLAESRGEKFLSYQVVFVCLVLTAVTLGVYLQVGSHQFLSFDDKQYVTGNPHVTSGLTGANVRWAFSSIDAFNWHPLTWLSHMADVQLYGMNPGGHHLTNVILHTASSLLLLLLLLRSTGSLWRSSFVAALFALHPLHVESVAWVAERKDVLSALFWFLTLLFYAQYATKRKPGLYLLALLSFVLGLMSKPMLVTLPAVMYLMDYWPLERYRSEDGERHLHDFWAKVLSLSKEKIPFFACSLVSIVITIYAQNKGGAVIGLSAIPLELRIQNALVAYVKYIGTTLWPSNLAVYYPFPASIPLWQVMGSLLVLLLLSVAAIRARRRYPFLVVGWFWFLITLLPVIGLIQVGRQAMADRYTYLPTIGIFIVVAWGVPELTRRLRYRQGMLSLLAGAALIASAVLTWHQLGYWQDSISLYEHTLQVTADNYLIHYNLGVDLAEKGDLDAAIGNLQAAIKISPNYTEAHNNLGVAFARKGNPDAAIEEYQTTLRINPNDLKAQCNLGDALARKGDPAAAIGHYQAAVRLAPDNPEVHLTLAGFLVQKGDLDAAILEYQAALQITPDNADAHNNLGVVLAQKGDLDAAIQRYQASLGINPNNADAHNNLGVALTRKGDLEAAIREYQLALSINPDKAEARNNMGIALAKKRYLDARR